MKTLRPQVSREWADVWTQTVAIDKQGLWIGGHATAVGIASGVWETSSRGEPIISMQWTTDGSLGSMSVMNVRCPGYMSFYTEERKPT